MTTTYTPEFGLAKPDDLHPLNQFAAILSENADKVEAALIRGGIAPPNATDLGAVAARVTTLENAAPLYGEYTSSASGLSSGAVLQPTKLTAVRQSAGMSIPTAITGGHLMLPAGLWHLQWQLVLTGAAVSGRNFLNLDATAPADANPVGNRQPFASVGDNLGGAGFVLPLSAPTAVSLSFLATTGALFSATHGIRVVRLGSR